MDHSSNVNIGKLASVNGSRSTFNRDRFINATFESGRLIPFYCEEVIPHDTFKLDMNLLIRSITPVAPTLDNAWLDVFFFWVPSRICTKQPRQFEQIHGENIDTYWTPEEEATLYNTGNTVDYYAAAITPESIGSYLGLGNNNPHLDPDTGEYDGTSFQISALQLKAYEKIYNEWFRDENLSAPVELKNYGEQVLYVNKLHDMFTSVLPAPQKASSVFLSLATSAPVKTTNSDVFDDGDVALHFLTTAGYQSYDSLLYVFDNELSNGADDVAIESYADPGQTAFGTTVDRVAGDGLYPSNLIADLSQATGVSINEFRFAAALQQFYERDARGGTRYREMIKSHYGVSVPENYVQVPELLGSKSILLNMNQVLQTSSTDAVSPLGTTGAFSNTFNSDRYFVKSFVEFGYVMGVCCVRPQLSYCEGIPRQFTRNRRYDWYYRDFANIGEQPIYKNQLYMPAQTWDGTKAWDVFGYNEAWADYRYTYNQNVGYFGRYGDANLIAWNYGAFFGGFPSLTSDFMQQEAAEVGQTLTISNADYQYIAQFYVKNKATRPMPLFSIPGLDRI